MYSRRAPANAPSPPRDRCEDDSPVLLEQSAMTDGHDASSPSSSSRRWRPATRTRGPPAEDVHAVLSVPDAAPASSLFTAAGRRRPIVLVEVDATRPLLGRRPARLRLRQLLRCEVNGRKVNGCTADTRLATACRIVATGAAFLPVANHRSRLTIISIIFYSIYLFIWSNAIIRNQYISRYKSIYTLLHKTSCDDTGIGWPGHLPTPPAPPGHMCRFKPTTLQRAARENTDLSQGICRWRSSPSLLMSPWRADCSPLSKLAPPGQTPHSDFQRGNTSAPRHVSVVNPRYAMSIDHTNYDNNACVI